MPRLLKRSVLTLFLFIISITASITAAASIGSWTGILRDGDGNPVGDATVTLHSTTGDAVYSSKTSPTGKFSFPEIAPGEYSLSIDKENRSWKLATPLAFKTDTKIGRAS